MTNLGAGVEIPTDNELFLLDKMREAWRVADGTPYESELRDVFYRACSEMLYSETLASRVEVELVRAHWSSPSNVIRRMFA